MNFYGIHEFTEIWRTEEASKNRDRLNAYVGSNKQNQRAINRKKGRKR